MDPTFTIDPGYSNYSIDYSPNIPGGAAVAATVPEPPSLAFVGAGLGMLVLLRRGRRRA